jgi:hypothetical protein
MPEKTGGSEPNAGDENSSTKSKDWFANIIAIVALGAFLLFTWTLYKRVDAATELNWGRSLYLLGGVEAIAFAAAGYIFGKEVHRQRADQAVKDADIAKKAKAKTDTENRELATDLVRKIDAYRSVRTFIQTKSQISAATAPEGAGGEFDKTARAGDTGREEFSRRAYELLGGTLVTAGVLADLDRFVTETARDAEIPLR